MSLNSVRVYNLCAAMQAGIAGAWLARSNPYVAGSELWKAWNNGRRMAATSAPGLGPDFVWFNPYTMEGQLKSDAKGWEIVVFD